MQTRRVVTASLAAVLSMLTSAASAALLVEVDKSAQTVTVSRDGQTLHRWPASTGKNGYATPSGKFTAFRMEADHFSREWDDAPMPHSVFFTRQGHAIHGSFDVKRLGSPASHGCVRLSPANAAVLFALVKQEGLQNTQVVLTGSEQIALRRLNGQGSRTGLANLRGGEAIGAEPTDEVAGAGSAQPLPPPLSLQPFGHDRDVEASAAPPPRPISPYPTEPQYQRPRFAPPYGQAAGEARGEPPTYERPIYDERRSYRRLFADPYEAAPRWRGFNRYD